PNVTQGKLRAMAVTPGRGKQLAVNASPHQVDRLSRSLFQDIDRLFIGRQDCPWNFVESDQGVEGSSLDNASNMIASLGRGERQELIQPDCREFMQLGVPRGYKRDVHNVGGIGTELADVARARDMDDVGFECAKGLGKNRLVTPKGQVVSLPAIDRKRHGPSLQIQSLDAPDPAGAGRAGCADTQEW